MSVPAFSRLPIRSVRLAADVPDPAAGWPWDLPVVAQLRHGTLELGPMTVLVGENGTGKSTLLKIMAGLEQVSNGEARLMPGFTVGILNQEPRLNEDKTVLGNVEEGVAETKRQTLPPKKHGNIPL